MDQDLSSTCDSHPSRYDCPDALLAFSRGRYGLIVHDGGSSTIEVSFCPWCGTRLGQEDADQREAPPWFGYSATLRTFGVIPDLDEISHVLSLHPTYSHRQGEKRTSPSDPCPHDMWAYEAPVDEGRPLHEHIDALWRSIRSHTAYILHLKETMTVDVFLGYRSNSDTAGVEVPPESLDIFTALRVPFGLSIIVS